MDDGYPQPVFLDATVLSNFATTEGISFLATLIDSPAVVPTVRDEIERGQAAGYENLVDAVDSFGDEVPLRTVSEDTGTGEIRDRLDAGEAATILGVLEHGGTIATDDLAARRVADSRDIPVTGSVGLLVFGVERNLIDGTTADEWLDTWRDRRGYYAPVESVAEILDGERE